MKPTYKTFFILLALYLCCSPAHCQSLEELKAKLTSLQSEVVAAKQKNDSANPLSTGIISFIDRPQQQTVNLAQHRPVVQKAFHWWQLALRQEYQPDVKADVTLADAPFGIDGAERRDDLIVCQHLRGGVAVQIVDGRSLTIAVLPPAAWNSLTPSYKPRNGLPVGPDWIIKEGQNTAFTHPHMKSLQGQAAMQNYVNVTFREMFDFDQFCQFDEVLTRVDTKQYQPGKPAFGCIVNYNRSRGWFLNGAITWWSDGKVILFNLRKVIDPAPSKLPRSNENAPAYGLSAGDARLFRRFSSDFDIDFNQVYQEALQDDLIRKPKLRPMP